VNKRRVFILSFSIVCVVIIGVGLLYWWSEQVAEQKLQECIRSLNSEGNYIIEERPFSDFHTDPDHVLKERDFTDFHQAVSISGIDHVYYDRGIHVLYFLGNGHGIEATVFNYKWGKM